MANSEKKLPSIPQVNNPQGLAEMLHLIMQGQKSKNDLNLVLQLKDREFSYRIAALQFFDLITRTTSRPITWSWSQIKSESSGINSASAEKILRKAIKIWNTNELGLRDSGNSEYEIWRALSSSKFKKIGEKTMARRVSSYKRLIHWALEREK
jgi:hypothetical protein